VNANRRNIAWAIALTMAVIAYGSLYPFAFHPPTGFGKGPFLTLLDSWDKRPGRGDLASNILLYMPMGFFGGIVAPAGRAGRQVALIVLLGALLSFTIECVQYYDSGRDTEATDFYANVAGTLLGAGIGYVFGRGITWTSLAGLTAHPMPALLLAAWIGYVLYPYVPTTNIHKYWDALKPVVLHPSFDPYAIFRQTAIWLGICLLVDAIAERRPALPLFAAYAALILGGSILIVTVDLSVPRLAGMMLAVAIWRLAPVRLRLPIAILLLGVYVPALRLEPFAFSAMPGPFHWTPFYGFMQGSIDLDVRSFCEKFFLYGTLIWLLARAGLRLAVAAFLVATVLLATSLFEVYIPGRSAEITDALIALGVGGIAAVLRESVVGAVPMRLPAAGESLTARVHMIER
jgi:VanZ family protein